MLKRISMYAILLTLTITPMFWQNSVSGADKSNKIVFIAKSSSGLSNDLYSVKDIFLGKVRYSRKSIKIYPVLRRGKIYEEFLTKYLNMTPSTYQGYWVRKTFSEGGDIPEIIDKTEDVINFVSDNKYEAVGFIYENELPQDETGIKKVNLK